MVVPKDISFADAVARLETIVDQLEGEEVPLEESLKLFEEGVELAEFCSVRLEEAEHKIERLHRDGMGELKTAPAEHVDEQ